ncbi:MAG: T9SS type A sorting domain-containing protein [Saprospiraceae bacterium]
MLVTTDINAALCTIKGYLRDDCWNSPIAGAELTIYVTGVGTENVVTDANGYFEIDANFLCNTYFTALWKGHNVGSGVANSGINYLEVRPRSYFTINGYSHYLQESNWANALKICETSEDVILNNISLTDVNEYRLNIYEDVYGAHGSLLYSSGWTGNKTSPCLAKADYLPDNLDITAELAALGSGKYYVDLKVRDCCSNESSTEWARVETTVQQVLDIDFNYGASTALEAAVSDGNSSDLLRIRTINIGTPTVAGANSISLKGIEFTNNSIQNYQVKISEVDCSTPSVSPSVLYTSSVLSASGGQMPDFDLDAEFLYLPTNRGWFQAATLGEISGVTTAGKCYEARITVTNLCDDPKFEYGYFTIYQGNPNARKANGGDPSFELDYVKMELEDYDSENQELRIFPNPAKDLLQISGIQSGSRLQIVDLNGQVFYSARSDMNQNKINLADFPPRCYYLKVVTDTSSKVIPFIKL